MTTLHPYSCLTDELLETIATLDSAVFPRPASKDDFARELRGKHNLCILIAKSGSTPVGYKIGYERSSSVFYSFSGGVVPESRRQGIARALLNEQHRIASSLGYSVVRTQTKNKYREMLILNLRCGFDVTGINHKSGDTFPSIILEKVLVPATSASR